MDACKISQNQIYSTFSYNDRLDPLNAETATSLSEDLNYIRSTLLRVYGVNLSDPNNKWYKVPAYNLKYLYDEYLTIRNELNSLTSSVRAYDFAIFFAGNPSSQQLLVTIVIPRNVRLTGGSVWANHPPLSSTWTANILRGTTSVGSIQILSGQQNGSVSFSPNPLNLSSGDILKITAPTTIDPYIRDISISLIGTLI